MASDLISSLVNLHQAIMYKISVLASAGVTIEKKNTSQALKSFAIFSNTAEREENNHEKLYRRLNGGLSEKSFILFIHDPPFIRLVYS